MENKLRQGGDDAVMSATLALPHTLPRRFALHRRLDVSGVSGTGVVAFGTTYPTGRTTLAWCAGEIASVTVYDSPEQVERIHGHSGKTTLVWIDQPNRGRSS